ncbi:MAG: hypothetical protein ACJAUQ_001520 [Maribacter sp.]|jgi:hypothetical protein
MRLSKIISIILLLTIPPMVHGQNITNYQWKNRLLFFVDKTIKKPTMCSQLKSFLKKADELDDREILIFQLTPKEVILYNGADCKLSPDAIYHHLSISKSFKGALLIGKDGGIKLKTTFEVQPEVIFSLIDGMPMRKSEIKKTKGN